MSNSTQPNLDWLAAKHAQEIICHLVDKDKNGNRRTDRKEIEKVARSAYNTVTKALGVLQENGVYACFLYLLAREGDNGRVVVEEMLNLLGGLPFGWQAPMKNEKVDTTAEVVLPHISEKVTENLERLLLAKETLEQMLIYARYGARARQPEEQ